MQPHLSHPAFLAAFCSANEKTLLCDTEGVILAASDALIEHSLNIVEDIVGQTFSIYSNQFSEQKPWFQNLASHHRETRVYGAAEIADIGELHQLNVISITPLQMANQLTGFKITLEDESLFEKSLPTGAWQQLFNDSHDGMCLFDNRFKVLTANAAFRQVTESRETSEQKISDLLAVDNDFKHWFLNAKLLSTEANILNSKVEKTAFISITPIDLSGQQLFWLTLKETKRIEQKQEKLSQSFQRFRSLFDNNIHGIALVSKTGKFLEANKQLGKLLEYDTREILGKHSRYFNAPGSYELSDSDAEIFMKSGFCKPFEKTLLQRSGEHVKVVVQLFPNYDADGQYNGAWQFIRKLDEHRQQHFKSAHFYEKLFQEGRDAMLLTDMDGNIKIANKAFAQLLKTDIDKLQQKQVQQITLADDYQLEQNCYFPQLLEQGYSDIYEKRYIASDGEQMPVSVRSILVTDHSGQPEAVWSVARDASIRRKLIESLADSERRFRSLFSSSFDAICFWTADHQLQTSNKAYQDLVGYSAAELRNLSYLDLTPPGWQETDKKITQQVNERGYSDIFEKEVLNKNGQRIPISIRASALRDSEDKIIGSWVIIRDISESKKAMRELTHSQNLLKQTSRMSRVGAWELSGNNKELTLTEETFQILSIPRSYHTSTKNIAKLLDTESEQAIVKALGQVLRGKGAQTVELKLMGFAPERWIRVSAQRGVEESGQRYAYGAVQDISDFKQQQRSLESARDTYQQLAFHDPLTELPNRLLLEDRFQQTSNQARRDKKMVALMIIDLDDFKAVNDIYGHPAGDALLVKIAKRLTRSLRSGDTVARLGGDEFVIIARLDDQLQAASLAKKILRKITKPVSWQDKQLQSGGSVGIALTAEHELSFESLYARADQALYQVKEKGKGEFAFFEQVD